MDFNIDKFDVAKFDSILAKGLSYGLGQRGEQVCIEAAICQTLDLPHGDDPQCVSAAVRAFKIKLNDSNWSSAQARAKGLRNLGLAQFGSKGVVGDQEFSTILGKKTITVLIPALFRQIFPDNLDCLNAAIKCERDGTVGAAAAEWAEAAAEWAEAEADKENPDAYLLLAAELALETLRELKSPGIQLLDKE